MKNFLSKCLEKDPEARPDANEMLKHPFLKKACNPNELGMIAKQAKQAKQNASKLPEVY